MLDILGREREQEDGVRRVSMVSELVGMESETPLLQEIFRFERHGLTQGQVQGEFVATGIVPRCAESLRQRGATMPSEWFQPRSGAK